MDKSDDRLTFPEHRRIIHIDMDAFYASVEQRDHPHLRGKPIAVGGGEKRGVTTTASYEARRYGVRSAMPGWKAKQLCPDLIFVKPRFEVYHEVSKQVWDIFKRYTNLIEPLSLDEAYLDVTENKVNIPHAMDVAKKIMQEVKDELHLTCSAGVSYCKFLAKIASGLKKPSGLTIIRPNQAQSFLEQLPIEQFFGIGKVTAQRMKQRQIHTGKDLKNYSRAELVTWFGKMGSHYYDMVRGQDDRPVQPNRTRKSIGVERTLESNLAGYQSLEPHLHLIAEKLWSRVIKSQKSGRTLTLKLKTEDFQTHTRSQSIEQTFSSHEQILRLGLELLETHITEFGPIRLIGLTLSNLQDEEDTQLKLPLE